MKHTILFLFAVALLFTSCSKDDVDTQDVTLIGTWKLSAIELTTELDTNNDGVKSINLIDENPIIDATLTFDTSNSGTFFYNSWVSFNTRTENNELVFMVSSTINSENMPKPFNYHSDDNFVDAEIDMTFSKTGGELSTLNIEGNTLKMHVENGFLVNDLDTGVETVRQDVIYVFTKSN
jgi:hypothetical protein